MCPTVSSVSGWLCSTPNTLWPCPGGSSNVLQPDSGRCPPMASSGGRQPVAQRGSEGLKLLILRDVTCVRDLHVTRGRNRRRDRPVPYRARDEVVLSGDHNGRAFNGREGWRMSTLSKWWASPNHALLMAKFIRTSALTRARWGADKGELGSAKYIGQAGSKRAAQVSS